MRHLENAFKFTFKNFLLTLPLLISLAIPALITGVGSLGFLAHRGEFIENFRRSMENITNGGAYSYGDLFAGIDMSSIIISAIISGLLSFVFMLLVRPATYGLINLHYQTGNARLNDFTSCMSKYIGRFVIYGLINIAIAVGFSVVLMILIFIGIFVTTQIAPLGILLLIGFVLGSIVGMVALYNYMALWFPAVCVEDSDVTDGLKNSFRCVKGNFWPILGITILVNLCGSVAGSILGGIIGLIPVVGSIVAPVITGLAEFILIVYYFEVYRERTGRYAIPEPPRQFDGFQNGGVQ